MASNTPYDDIFKTLINDLKPLTVALINEIFDENYEISDMAGNEEKDIVYQDQETAQMIRRFANSNLIMLKNNEKNRYHLEFQTWFESIIAIRMIEYDLFLMMKDHSVEDGILTYRYPQSAIICLNVDKRYHGDLTVKIRIGKETIFHRIRVINIRDYDLEELFRKKLYILLPFFTLTLKRSISEQLKDQQEIEEFYDLCRSMIKGLRMIREDNIIDEKTYYRLLYATIHMLNYQLNNYSKKKRY